MNEPELMKLAIEKTREGISAGQSPFGAVLVKDGVVVAVTHETVWHDRADPSRPRRLWRQGMCGALFRMEAKRPRRDPLIAR